MTNSNQIAHRFRSKLIALIAVLVATTVAVGAVGVRLSAAERPRLLVLTDIGGDPDDQQSMIRLMLYSNEFPGMFYILSKAAQGRDKREAVFRSMYLTGDESLTSREWIDKHVRSSGPLGALYPVKTWTAPNRHGCLKEGDTPSWFFFLPRSGNDPANPTQPGWGGRTASRPKAGIAMIDPPARIPVNRSAAGGRTSSKTSPAACRGAGNGSRVSGVAK